MHLAMAKYLLEVPQLGLLRLQSLNITDYTGRSRRSRAVKFKTNKLKLIWLLWLRS